MGEAGGAAVSCKRGAGIGCMLWGVMRDMLCECERDGSR